ncbi:Uncharacterized protein conserved in bacteria [Acholeplasma oculi]|uniref:DUF1343 domain-containing protein n=1 Tax=Acholeplasma oculi TaxID=35623 RepID=A0A061ACX5_9MOLU|nr:DUF1343 domain-containing protein [Acholeplasma oculi]CDR31254.1 hypothetical protein, uncharacterised UCP016719 [Acholeplasma oculi]SKC38441.1 Uncharacterized conserved protein YbbC, DUF1343 family [Acholeplasma oculi]SUT91363.1 Uncharacterized protein conserved in bacteria [Acholeplasma oculi]
MFKLGIERIDSYMHLFEGKRVGLITNPTGVSKDLRLSADILNEKVNLTTLFGPEHGIRGNAEAGVYVDSYFDEKLNKIVHSLYGKNRRPNDEMLKDVDVLCYDMQDVGARFYTYIYTMSHAMTAAKERGLKFVVFDRPNVLGHDIEGNILDLTYRSFVGYYPITQRYGLTIGELAMYFNDVFEINCDLEVIKMEGYRYDLDFSAYDIPWLSPSPNLPTRDSAFVYLATCIFEGTNVSEGRGTTRPFTMIGAPYIDADQLCDAVSKLQIEGIKVRPIHFTPNMSKHVGEACHGIEIFVRDHQAFKPVRAGYRILNVIRNLYPDFKFLPPWKEGQNQMIDLLTGSQDLKLNKDEALIFEGFKKDEEAFKASVKGYRLYE